MTYYHHIVRAMALVLLLSIAVMPATLEVSRGSNLQSVINYASDGDTILLSAKAFEGVASPFVDPLCGNCLDPQTEVTATTGFEIRDKALVLIGADREQTRLVTNAGYGVYFENSFGSELKNLTITGGKRDADGNATDAGVVIRNSRVLITGCDISDNDHRLDTVVVGIGGVFGREGSDITVRDSRIVNNGWDGIALYRGAVAVVTDCLIAQGRGAGIGVTWDATCLAFRNEISGYWKGIGSFGTSVLVARNNYVHGNLGWGLVATGESMADFINNVVDSNGNCGIAPWSAEARGRIINNIVINNGWREQWVCPCVGVWNNGDWAKWEFAHNIVWNNEAGNYEEIFDQTGMNGNLSTDPLFNSDTTLHLQDDSPGRHAGDSLIYNTDGTVSHIGLYGGPQAFPIESPD